MGVTEPTHVTDLPDVAVAVVGDGPRTAGLVDALLSRGMMGDGVIDFGTIGRWVAAAGYTGPVEVEIFNQEIFDQDPDVVLAVMKERWESLVLPSLTGAPARATA